MSARPSLLHAGQSTFALSADEDTAPDPYHEELVENCPHPDCGGYLLNNRCTAAECPAVCRSCRNPLDEDRTCGNCAR
ncbi:hypothetical protein [Streptomyces sp. NBC_01601]|uniref:hypothetical protein n=1 Tax=Streptomyces sp. NBC_01601 TaxID=2975892 RepID=UPI002E2DD099|nr:hypothetical protein [Streptomyces sp. NBC_01601]